MFVAAVAVISLLGGLAGDGRDVQQTFRSGDHSLHPFLFHPSTPDLGHSQRALVWLEVPQQHQNRSVKRIREAGEMLFCSGLCLSLSWDSKGEIWLSCASCRVGVCLHSSQMKRLEMKMKSCGVRTAQCVPRCRAVHLGYHSEGENNSRGFEERNIRLGQVGQQLTFSWPCKKKLASPQIIF